MGPSELRSDQPWPWVGLVNYQGKIGTGFIVRDKYALTAAHFLGDEKDKVLFVLKGREFDAEIILRLKGKDIALIKVLSDDLPPLTPLPVGCLPKLPIPYVTWGYRLVQEHQLLQGHGEVRAWLNDKLLQLETRAQRPGMSGCPVVINGRGGFRVVAVGFARHYPEEFPDDESLAFAYSLAPIPPEVLQHCDLKELPADESLERTAEALDKLAREKSEASNRMSKGRDACAIGIFAVFGIAGLRLVGLLNWLPAIDSLTWLPVLAILTVLSYLFGHRTSELKRYSHYVGTFAGVIRTSNPDEPLPQGYWVLWEEFKKNAK